jgi:hypothetical protein
MPLLSTLERFVARPEGKLAYQRWEGEHIAQEQFFYDPKQVCCKNELKFKHLATGLQQLPIGFLVLFSD